VRGGVQTFYDSSTLNASGIAGRDAIEGGEQNFYGTSQLQAATSNAVDGGEQNFHETSILQATAPGAINSGVQFFRDSSRLNVTGPAGSGYIRGGSQTFVGTSSLNLNRTSGVTGGRAYFYENSVLNANVTNAVNHVGAFHFIVVGGEAIVNAWATNAFGTNTELQWFPDHLAGPTGGTLRLNGFDTQFGVLIGESSLAPGVIENRGENAATLTVAGSATSSFSGLIRDGSVSGSLAIAKTGEGLWILGGGNSFSGGTSLVDGTIRVAHDNALGSGAVTIASDAVLSASGTRALANTIVNQGTVSGDAGNLLTLSGDVSGAGSILWETSNSPVPSAPGTALRSSRRMEI
jgi:fibronectin-binding autotransporter adhesin